METVTIHNEILPKGWNVKKLGDLSDITTGSKDVNEGNPAGQYPFFTCSRDVHASDSYSFDTEAILVAGNGVVGETKYYKGKFEAYQRTYILNNFKVNPLFLYFYLKGKLVAELHRHISGSTMPYIKRGDLEGVEVPVPLNNEQQTIAAILSKIQEAIENQDKIIKSTTELKAALMRKLFSEGLKRWEKVEFSKALQPAKKLGKSKQILSSQIKKEGKYPVVDQGQDFIAGFCDDEAKVIKLKIPVIIFGDHTRFFKYVDFPFVIGADGVKVLEADIAEFNPKFLFHYLSSLEIPSRGYNRHFKILKEQIILKPSMEEQIEIAHTLDVIDAKIENAQKLTGAKTDLFKSMLNNLMSGELRVNNITL